MHVERHPVNCEGLREAEDTEQGLGTPEPKHVRTWNWLSKTGTGETVALRLGWAGGWWVCSPVGSSEATLQFPSVYIPDIKGSVPGTCQCIAPVWAAVVTAEQERDIRGEDTQVRRGTFGHRHKLSRHT